MLEGKFLQTVDYVEPSEVNYSAYSNEYAYLLQSVGGELDTIFKVYCSFPLEDYKKMTDYKPAVLAKYSDIVYQEIIVKEYSLKLTPFKDWDSCALKWWTAYNSVKHNRYGKFHLASQKNVLNILAALFLLEMKFVKEIAKVEDEPDIPEPQSELFVLKNWENKWMSASGAMLHSL